MVLSTVCILPTIYKNLKTNQESFKIVKRISSFEIRFFYFELDSTGGSGSGLRVATQTTNGTVTAITVVARGVGYRPGDIVTIVGGNNNATFRVINIQQSNGEIEIEEVENGLFTGKYKFNAVNEEGQVITFSEGVFYKIPLSTF